MKALIISPSCFGFTTDATLKRVLLSVGLFKAYWNFVVKFFRQEKSSNGFQLGCLYFQQISFKLPTSSDNFKLSLSLIPVAGL